ncbi:ABC transporter permease [Prauserella marina]|uniref:Osmoprotectant transport system permease protein n=1 Tax=Prauserella marina TaxID=530584 RepID=A0A222VS21_9PSEU|nr:ABC transporter permease [Prauserella marina]ASR36745.1 ABC transporter permease [Prauserella marina]PWV80368.1 osmoprotectant transport system permease protein [Prauserella marina]SDD52813.1 osmoprotectant transport system permease protein [Prauserella marina]
MKWDWVADHVPDLVELTGQHAYLALLPVLFGLLISVPLGVLCVRWPKLYPPVFGGANLLYALPSIALFIVLIDYTGLTAWTAIIPLTLYTFSVLIPNVVDGLRSVPDASRQAATAMGFGTTRRLVQIELPIAVPVIMAGLRVATVSSISMVSVAALVGLGGLGQLFTDGFQRDFPTEIIVGIVLTVLLAFVCDALLVLAQRLLTPWARARVTSR